MQDTFTYAAAFCNKGGMLRSLVFGNAEIVIHLASGTCMVCVVQVRSDGHDMCNWKHQTMESHRIVASVQTSAGLRALACCKLQITCSCMTCIFFEKYSLLNNLNACIFYTKQNKEE